MSYETEAKQVTRELRECIENKVLKQYQKVVANG